VNNTTLITTSFKEYGSNPDLEFQFAYNNFKRAAGLLNVTPLNISQVQLLVNAYD
jgi:hypothetical protein